MTSGSSQEGPHGELRWEGFRRLQHTRRSRLSSRSLMWGGTAIANKVAVGYMDGLTAGVLRSMLARAIAVVVAVLFKLGAPSDAKERALLIASGTASFALWPTLMSIGIERTTASHAAVIMATIPNLTVLLAHILERRLPSPAWWLAATAAFGATVALVLTRTAPSMVSLQPPVSWVTASCGGGLVCVLGYVAGGRLSARIGNVPTMFWSLAAALPPLAVVFGFVALDTAWSRAPVEG